MPKAGRSKSAPRWRVVSRFTRSRRRGRYVGNRSGAGWYGAIGSVKHRRPVAADGATAVTYRPNLAARARPPEGDAALSRSGMGTAMNIPLPTNAAGHAQGRVDASPAAVAVGEQAVARLRARLVNLMQLPMSANRRGSSMSARSKPPGSRKAMFAQILKARHEDRTLAATALEKAAAATSAAHRLLEQAEGQHRALLERRAAGEAAAAAALAERIADGGDDVTFAPSANMSAAIGEIEVKSPSGARRSSDCRAAS